MSTFRAIGWTHVSVGGSVAVMNPEQHAQDQKVPSYLISTTSGGRIKAGTIPDALAALAGQLTEQLPTGPVAWTITDPTGTEHSGNNNLNDRLDLLTTAVQQLVDALYTELHRSHDGGPPQVDDAALRR